MPRLTKDPLLAFAKGLTWFFIGVMAFAAVAILIATPFVVLKQGDIFAELAAKGVTAGSEFIAAVVILLLCIAAMLGLAIWFLRLLQKIIDSVGEGDPFVPVNAGRLSRMGWIMVGGYVLAIPLSVIGTWVAGIAADAGEDASFDLNLGGGGLLLILVLFVLARVFRRGAAMREDLEGTV